MKRAVIIGGTSGIGRALAEILCNNEYQVTVTGRRTELLKEISSENPDILTECMDLADVSQSLKTLNSIFEKPGNTSLIVISAGTGHLNPSLEWNLEKDTIDVNVTGFTAMVGAAFSYLKKQGSGHIAAITSIAALRGSREAPAYNASKAYMSNYLEGLRQKSVREKLNIVITDVQPGFVNTAMAKGDGIFWMASKETAAQQIFQAVRQRKNNVVITRRWRLISLLLKILPGWIYNRL